MFESFSSMKRGQAASPGMGDPPTARLGKAYSKKPVMGFWLLNVIIMPLVALTYLTVGAAGLRETMGGVFQTKIYRLPFAGAGKLQAWDGWDKMDIAMPVSLLMFVAVTVIWAKLWKGTRTFSQLSQENPIKCYAVAGMSLVLIAADSVVCYFGLSSTLSSGWGEPSPIVPIVATAAFTCGLALIGCWHDDHSRKHFV